MESTKLALVKAIHSLTDYTLKQIEAKYNEAFTKHKWRAKYYAKKHAIKVLQGWLVSLRQKKWLGKTHKEYLGTNTEWRITHPQK